MSLHRGTLRRLFDIEKLLSFRQGPIFSLLWKWIAIVKKGENLVTKFYQGGKSNVVAVAVTDRKIEHARCTNEIQSLDVFSLRA